MKKSQLKQLIRKILLQQRSKSKKGRVTVSIDHDSKWQEKIDAYFSLYWKHQYEKQLLRRKITYTVQTDKAYMMTNYLKIRSDLIAKKKIYPTIQYN